MLRILPRREPDRTLGNNGQVTLFTFMSRTSKQDMSCQLMLCTECQLHNDIGKTARGFWIPGCFCGARVILVRVRVTLVSSWSAMSVTSQHLSAGLLQVSASFKCLNSGLLSGDICLEIWCLLFRGCCRIGQGVSRRRT